MFEIKIITETEDQAYTLIAAIQTAEDDGEVDFSFTTYSPIEVK